MSGLGNYARAALELAYEWELRLTKQEWRDLYKTLQQISLPEWETWKMDQKSYLQDLISQTPAKVARSLSNISSSQKGLYVFAVSQLCYEAAKVLDASWRIGNLVGTSYRQMTRYAACIAQNDDPHEDASFCPDWNFSVPPPYKGFEKFEDWYINRPFPPDDCKDA